MTPALRTNRGIVDPFDSMNRDLDRFVRRVFSGEEAPTPTPYGVDIYEINDQLHVEAELPGFTREQVNVTVDGDVLTIAADRTPAEQTADAEPPAAENTAAQPTWFLRERRYWKVSRSFTLPKTIDGTNVNAKLADGVLHLTLNKREEAKPRKITIG